MSSKHVYAILADDNTIKVGISKHPYQRFKEIQNASGKTIIKQHISIKTINAHKIEKLIFIKFGLYRKKGEWFSGIDYEDVILHMKFYDYSDEQFLY
jgi:hypothetical protein